MLDNYQEKQNIVYKILKNALVKDKISHAYLFETNGSNDAKEMIISFAKSLLCPYKYTNNNNCVNCTQCSNIDKNCFLEFKIIRPDGMWIKKEQLDELQKEFSMKSVESNRKVYIIENADRLNPSSANTILKFLEEPAENIVAILVADNTYQVLETIVSRCQIVSFKKNKIDNKTNIIERINSLISVPEELIQEEKVEEKVNQILQFVQYLEANKLDCLLFTQKLWHENINSKELTIFAFNILILYYKDMLNKKVDRCLNVFDEDPQFNKIVNNNTIEELNRKLKIIIENKEQIQYNANTSLLIDKLIIELVGGVK